MYLISLKKQVSWGCKSSRVPIEQNHKIGSDECSPVDKIQDHKFVGKLIYLSQTRLGIAYVASMVIQFMPHSR